MFPPGRRDPAGGPVRGEVLPHPPEGRLPRVPLPLQALHEAAGRRAPGPQVRYRGQTPNPRDPGSRRTPLETLGLEG